ncbi:MAG: FtsW/RodA/SpoVE family cell cycle protein [Rikenellaceae bacterium]
MISKIIDLKNKFEKTVGGDLAIWIVIIFLLLFSTAVVYSSTGSLAYARNGGRNIDYLISQGGIAVLGLAVVYLTHLLGTKFYTRKFTTVFYWFAILLTVLTFFVGVEINGEKRWLRIPLTSSTFQPSDVLKIALVMLLSKQLSSIQKRIKKVRLLPFFVDLITHKNIEYNKYIFNNFTLKIIAPIALSCVLVVITNLSTAIIIYLACLGIFILGRIRIVEIFRFMGVTIVAFALLFAILKVTGGRAETWENRINSFISPVEVTDSSTLSQDDYQKHQAKIAIASGWIMGKGPGGSTQRSNLPHPYSDYAFAFIVEEYGIVAAIFLLVCYLTIFYRTIRIFNRCYHSFLGFVVLGLGLIITIQVMFHVGISVAIFPVSGQPLPLISKGGSSMIFTCIMLGIIQGISRQINIQQKQQKINDNLKLIGEDGWDQIILDQEAFDNLEKEEHFDRFFDYNTDDEYDGILWNERDKNESDS